jgi:hypothetical protein
MNQVLYAHINNKRKMKKKKKESVLPKVKSWRDARETLCRKNHQEEAKL